MTDYTELNLTAAKTLAATGLPVFPVLITKSATGLEKKPVMVGWQTAATTDPISITTWWKTYPDAVPGIALTGLVILDLDRHHGRPDGVAAFRKLHAGQDPIDPPITRTASNGFHLAFAQPEGKPFGNARGNLPDGIDVRGRGGFVVAPGAITPWGAWRSEPGKPTLIESFKSKTIPILPAWLATIIRPPVINTSISTAVNTTITTTTPGNREEAWAAAALEGIASTLAATRPGTRNHALNASAYRLGRMAQRGWVGQSEIENRLFQASEANLLVNDDGPHKVRATIQSGFTAGLQKPHPDLPERE